MRLELVLQNPTSAVPVHRWQLERGRRTVGRSPDCDWQLPDEDRCVSKVHCVIERRGDSFVLVDRSSNGSQLDGLWLQDGASAPLRDGSMLGIGNLSFRVSILGERVAPQEDPDDSLSLSPETPTISSILSDIVPAGQMASGVLVAPERDDPFAFIQSPKSAAASSRNVEIGWDGPPEPDRHAKVLPENWWEETEPDMPLGHVLEHSAATRVSIGVSRASEVGGRRDDVRIVQAMEPDFEPLPGADASRSHEVELLLKPLEQALEQTLATLQISGAVPDANAPGASPGQGRLSSRLRALLSMQLRVNEAIETMFSECGRLFDPRLIAARADAEAGRGFSWSREAIYWRFYSRQFDTAACALSAADLLRKTYSTDEPKESAGVESASREGKRPDAI
ncbi:FHA domain protein [Rhizobium sp. RU35A]|uniref:type VI secretion system-associated FHA domain protein n=1 Tax=Rhizobium sp. RU35A TaxID=1907414 RepID=UPI000956B114|nr:FHA domain-containing protein [Rhizobium sp. RU35A]SIQ49105.1 FHA domain protein [Rhizobium sp. RU35A]